MKKNISLHLRNLPTGSIRRYSLIAIVAPLLAHGFKRQSYGQVGPKEGENQSLDNLNSMLAEELNDRYVTFTIDVGDKKFFIDIDVKRDYYERSYGDQPHIDISTFEGQREAMSAVAALVKEITNPPLFPFVMPSGVGVTRSEGGNIEVDCSNVLNDAWKEINRRLALEKEQS